MNGVQQEAQGISDSLDSAAASQPLHILVTGGAREQMALRTLARQAIPMLRRPEEFPGKQRHQLAQAFEELLDAPYDSEDDDAEGYGAGNDGEGREWP